MKLAAAFGFVAARARYLALALPVFALFSTVQAGCANSAHGGYYYGTTSSSGTPTRDCPAYTIYTRYGGYESFNSCDDYGGYGSP